MPNRHFLITGSTGKTGRRVADLLEARGLDVRRAGRSAPTRFDWTDPDTWALALDGRTDAYLVYPDLGAPHGRQVLRAFADQAVNQGVERAVIISFPNTGGDSMDFAEVLATEQQLTDAGLGLTVLRLRWFSQNFSEDFLHPAVVARELRLPAGTGQEAFVDADDIAEVAVACLTDPRHAGASYEVTGPRLLSFYDVADELSRATGRTITYTPVTVEAFVAEQVAQGVPEEWAQMLAGLYGDIASGALASVSADVAEVLGTPPRDFTNYAAVAAASGIWSLTNHSS